jgi:hypothetical protein
MSHAMKMLDLSQAKVAVLSGGIESAMLRADGAAFFVELETRNAGAAVLVTSNRRRPRAFRNPMKALEVIMRLGLEAGQFSLEGWKPEQAETERRSRPDRAMALRQTYANAATYDRWVREQGLDDAMNEPISGEHAHAVERADAMLAQPRMASMRKV